MPHQDCRWVPAGELPVDLHGCVLAAVCCCRCAGTVVNSVVNNTFSNVFVVMRGDVRDSAMIGNTFTTNMLGTVWSFVASLHGMRRRHRTFGSSATPSSTR